MFSLLVLLTVKQVLGNKYCSPDICTSCTSGYNFFSTSCLDFCPSGYYLDVSSCKANSTQDLFSINFVSFRNFDANSIESFSHPENYKFANDSKSTPFPTLDRGFYFFSSSFLVSNTSWILGPRFCFGIYFRVFSAGVIFQVVDNSKVYFEVRYNGTYVFNHYYTDGVKDYNHISTYSYSTNWVMIRFLFYQYKDYHYLYLPGFSGYINNREFRMDTNNAYFILGSPNNSSFTGFLAYICAKNSNNCFWKSLLANNCLPHQYHNVTCKTCPTSCSSFCTRSTCNKCYSRDCSSCTGYLLKDCENCSNSTLEACNLGKNCAIGSGFKCSDCLSNYVLINGLCISPPTNFSEIILRLDYFTMYQGVYFQSGINASTYSPFNDPEEDDPTAINNRGYWFNYTQYMIAPNVTLNYTFTFGMWVFSNSIYIISCSKFNFMYDGSISIPLENHEKNLREYVDGECSSPTWKLIGIIVDFYNDSTHFSVVCGTSIIRTQSISGYAFYDDPGEIKITPVQNNTVYIYRVLFSQRPLYDLSKYLIICSVQGSSNCLAFQNYLYYNSSTTGRPLLCHSSCTKGCSTWGSCNKCKSIWCTTCDNFNETCIENLEVSPCVAGFNISENNKTCCPSRCLACHGSTSYQCTKCTPEYVQVGSFCTKNCPSGFTLSGNICSATSNINLLNITFNKISDSFNDSFNNQFFTGSTKDFYPNLTINDPIPSKSRGFYFTNSSFIDTSNFSIPVNFSISFWLRQTTDGILLSKNLLKLTASSFKYSSFYHTIVSIPSNTWIILDFIGFVNVEYYQLYIRTSPDVFSTFYPNCIFDDPFSPMRIGAKSNGFVGFIWQFVVYYGRIAAAVPFICSASVTTDCLWNCELNFHYFNNSCQPCLSSCRQGCVRSTDCNLCLDFRCLECLQFDYSCETCIENSTKSLNCECNSRYYWNDSLTRCLECIDHCAECRSIENCLKCDQNFTFNGTACVCLPGLYYSNGVCLPCNIPCKTCSGPLSNECNSCLTVHYLINGTCQCPPRFYPSGSECLNCLENCLICQNSVNCSVCEESFLLIENSCVCPNKTFKNARFPSGEECLRCSENCFECQNSLACSACEETFILIENNCVCPNRTFKNTKILQEKCLECHNTCLSCYDNSYFSCNSCENYFLSGICYEKCPIGFKTNQSNCIPKNILALSFHFDSDEPLLEKITKKASRLSCKPSKTNPFPLPQRGLYFPELSSCIEYKDKEHPLLSPLFSISFWLKIVMNSEVFSIDSSESFGIMFKVSNESCLHLVLDNESYILCIEEKKNDWNHFLLALVNNSSHSIKIKINTQNSQQMTLPFFPYKDSPGSILIIGSHSNERFLGFIYSFEIFISEPDISELSRPGINCPYFPSSSSECLSECNPFQYENGTLCLNCSKKCIFGCLNSSNCIQCSSPDCYICNNLIPDVCFNCLPPNELFEDHCKSCKSSEYFSMVSEKCLPCPVLCLSCFSDSTCSSCKEKSYLVNNSTCNCIFGYTFQNDLCLKLYFEVEVKVNALNVIELIFNETLQESLKSKDIIIKVNFLEINFILTEKISDVYSIQVLLPDELKSVKSRKVILEFNENITSIQGANLEKTFFEFELFDKEIPETSETLSNLQETGKTVTTASAAAALASGAILMNPTMLFNLLSLVEMFSYTLLFDIEFHVKFIEFIVSLKKSSKFPNFKIPYERKERKLPQKYENYGISSSLLIVNSGYLIAVAVLVGLLAVVAHFGTFLKYDGVKIVCQKIKETVYFAWLFRICIQACFDLTVYVLLSLKYSDFGYFICGFDVFVCCAACVFIGFCFFCQIYCVAKIEFPVTPSEFKRRFPYFSKIFEEFQCDSWNKCVYYMIFIARRVCLSVSIIYLNGIFQLSVGISFCLMNVLYLLLVKPFKEYSQNYVLLVNELLLLVFYLGYTLKEINLIQVDLDDIAVFGIRVIIGTLGFNILSNLLNVLYKIISIIKVKCMERLSKVTPMNQTTVSYQMEKNF